MGKVRNVYNNIVIIIPMLRFLDCFEFIFNVFGKILTDD